MMPKYSLNTLFLSDGKNEHCYNQDYEKNPVWYDPNCNRTGFLKPILIKKKPNWIILNQFRFDPTLFSKKQVNALTYVYCFDPVDSHSSLQFTLISQFLSQLHPPSSHISFLLLDCLLVSQCINFSSTIGNPQVNSYILISFLGSVDFVDS